MQVLVKDEGPCRKILQLEIPADEVGKQYDEMLKSYRKQARIPGFRPGKAPQKVVENRYGKEISTELKDRLIPKAYHEAVEQEKMDVVTVVNVSECDVQLGQPFSFDVTIDVLPDFEVTEYKGIAIKAEKKEVTDEDVNAAMAQMMDRFARFDVVTDRPVQEHDVIQVAFEGTCDGQPVEELAPEAKGVGSSESSWVAADENEFLPGLGTGLIGASVDDSKTIEVTFPDSFQVAELAGKKAEYVVTVKDIRTKVLPDLDEEMLKNLHVESEEQLLKALRDDLESRAAYDEQGRRKGEIIKYLLANQTFDLPESDVAEETRNAVYEIVQENTRRGVQEGNITENKEQIFEAATKNANERVKLRYILHKIAEAEKITVKPGEVDSYLAQMAMSHGMSVDQLRKDLIKRNALDNVHEDLQKQKTLDFILSVASVEE